MSWVTYNYANWQFWEGYPNQKVVFDGPSKTIFVSEGVTDIDVRADLYSAWKEWLINSPENPSPLAYPAAISVTGGDPITDVSSVGATYFLENGWRIQPFDSNSPYVLTVVGNIYTREPGGNPFLFAEGVSVSLTRSNIVEQIYLNGTSGGGGATAQEIWTYNNRSLTTSFPVVPTVTQIRQEIDTNSAKLIAIKAKTDTIVPSPTVEQIRAEMDTNSSRLASIQSKTDTIVPSPTVEQIRAEIDTNSSRLASIQSKTDTIVPAPTVQDIRTEMDTNSTKLQAIVSAIASLPQNTQDIVMAMLAALNATTIPVNIKAVNDQQIVGTGTEQDPWGP